MLPKLLIFTTATTLVALAYGGTFALFNNHPSTALLSTVIILSFLFLALFLIQTLLVTELRHAITVICIETIACGIPLFFLRAPFTALTYSAFPVLFILLLWGHFAGRHLINNMITPRFFSVKNAVLRKSITGITLFSVLVFVSLLNIPTLIVPRAIFQYIVSSFEYTSKYILPGFSRTMTIQDTLEITARRSLGKKLLDQIPAEQARILTEATAALGEKINEWTDMRVNLQQSVADGLYGITNAYVKRITKATQTPVLVAIGVVLFIFITGFAFLFAWIIAFISWVIFRLLLATKFITIVYQSKETERVSL